jgi:hypothetical protein
MAADRLQKRPSAARDDLMPIGYNTKDSTIGRYCGAVIGLKGWKMNRRRLFHARFDESLGAAHHSVAALLGC